MVKKVKDDYSAEDVKAWREKHEMTITGELTQDIKPLRSFQESGFDKDILTITEKFDNMTPV